MWKILFTIPNFITAGSGRAMLNIIERLDRHEFEPAVCVSRKGGKLDREVEQMGIPFIEAPFTLPATPYATLPFRAFRAAVPFRRFKFDLWHSFHYADDYTEPLIAYLSGARSWVYTKKNMNWNHRSWRLRSLLARRIAAQNTAMLRDFFQSTLLRRKTLLVPRGVDTAKFQPNLSPALNLRSQLRIDSGALVIATVGHLLPVKGHPALLRALARVPDVHLWIAGEPLDADYHTSLLQLCGDLSIRTRVHFLGGIASVGALHAEVDIFVHPSRQEGCPVALLEAMACGKACIATDIAGSQDLIENDKCGLLVPLQDDQAMQRALARLIADPAMRVLFQDNARRRILEHYSIEREVQLHQDLYRRALGLS